MGLPWSMCQAWFQLREGAEAECTPNVIWLMESYPQEVTVGGPPHLGDIKGHRTLRSSDNGQRLVPEGIGRLLRLFADGHVKAYIQM